ncbi:MAG: glutamine-hydrolyzing carbamoyl-phosphate synthase small subunit [Oscillospiraceae bacterium]|nr:glutamine-hydrolyzing carbamoyl-phosphate synthase small subunit [Oscillospiraceae bacterium]
MIFENNKKASLVLADGTVFEGRSFGAEGKVIGEVVFNTSVVGYQETLTDPAYCGQLIVQTFPLIGNYGVNSEDDASEYHAAGYIVREYCEEPSNFRCEGRLEDYLVKYGTVGICDIDTRALTRVLRENGVMNGAIVCGDYDKDALLAEIKAFAPAKLIDKVGGKEKKSFAAEGGKYNVAVIDYGMTKALVSGFNACGCNVTVMPFNASAEQVLAEKPDGIVLAGGAGDPAQCATEIEVIKELLKSGVPVYGINFGHLLLALANGVKIEKLKYGHRGANTPVKDTECAKVFIASQNHGYAVAADGIPAGVAEITHVIGGDNTVQGVKYLNAPAFGTQFQPEISGNPHDTGYLYDRFIKMMEDRK